MFKSHKYQLLLIITLFTITFIPNTWAYKTINKVANSKIQTSNIRVLQTIPEDLAQNVAPDTNIIVEFSGNIPSSFYQNVNLNLLQGNKLVEGELFYNPATKQIMFKPKYPLKSGVTYTGYVSWLDSYNQKQEKIWNFIVNNFNYTGNNQNFTSNLDNTQNNEPFIPEPQNNAILKVEKTSITRELPPNKPLEITFSDQIDIMSLKNAPIKLYQNNEIEVGIDYRLSKDRRTITIVPREPLKNFTSYTVTINNNIFSSNGLKLDKNYALQFRVGSSQIAVDENFIDNKNNYYTLSQPISYQNSSSSNLGSLNIISIFPQNNQIVNNLSQAIYVTFNEELREETVNEFTFKLEDDFGPIPARIRYIKGKKQAILTPIGVLDAGKKYRVVLTRGIVDIYGRNLNQDITSYFSVNIERPTNSFYASSSENNSNYQNIYGNDISEIENENYEGYELNNQASEEQVNIRSFANRSPKMKNFTDGLNINKFGNSYNKKANSSQRFSNNIPTNKRAYASSTLSTFKVSRILPGVNAVNVPRNTKVYIYFSEPVNVSTINSVNISIFGEQKRVEGKVFYDAAKLCAIFVPDEPLRPDTEYKVIISDKIRSYKGEYLAGKVKWQFLTAKEPIKTLNYKISSLEADAAFDIPLLDKKGSYSNLSKSKVIQNSNFSKAPLGITTIRDNHWIVKSLKHLSSKGLLYNINTNGSITRYEITNAISTALNNLRQQQYKPTLKLKLTDLTELYKLVYEFKRELKAFAIETSWFENFMHRNGVTEDYIDATVRELNNRYN